jgi:hypothetical protein
MMFDVFHFRLLLFLNGLFLMRRQCTRYFNDLTNTASSIQNFGVRHPRPMLNGTDSLHLHHTSGLLATRAA